MNEQHRVRGEWRGHLTRCIAVFFVLFTFADLAFSHYLQHDPSEGVRSAGVAPTGTDEPVADTSDPSNSRADGTRHDPSSESPCNDECCFCCARVLPGGSAVFRVPTRTSRAAQTALGHDSSPTPFLSGTYRPPRHV